jgi:molybdopterin molybdotransferase
VTSVADWLCVAEARERILAAVARLPSEERPLDAALGAVLAEPIVSPIDVPLWDNSAMDGFAVRAADVRGATAASPRTLRVTDDIAAGARPKGPLSEGCAARVMTGASVPDGADGVVRVEHTDGGHGIGTSRATVRIDADSDASRNIRRRGEELRSGARVLEPGAVVGPGTIGVAASLGHGHLRVVRRPRVAVLASGDELVGLDDFEEVRAGRRIVSSNSYALAAQLAEIGAEVVSLGIAADSPGSLRSHIASAEGCDALVSSAGVSMGELDLMREVLSEMGLRTGFWRVRMRPGSPMAFGTVAALGGIPWFGLPGNPVSAMVTFEVFVRPALLRMAGHGAVYRPTARCVMQDRYAAPAGLSHFVRVRLDPGPDGRPRASLTGAQGSGMLTSMALADGLAVMPEERGGLAVGDEVDVLRLGAAPPQAEPGY